MWLLNEFPSARVEKRYGFSPTQPWLDHVRLSSVKLAGGCSGSFVSDRGLVMTNHHCAKGCIEQVSTKEHDYIKHGFYAKTDEAELKCPGMEVLQLTAISDVTARVTEATKGLADAAYSDAERAAFATIEKACSTSDKVRCDVVSLYRGGKYHLYQYQRFQDVRLAFAPEQGIAAFGGDPDNFNFPRYDLDVSFLRLYDDNKPAASPQFFKWSAHGAKDGELTFVSGHPASTSRLLTVAQLEYRRDVRLPELLLWLAEVRGTITEYQKRGPEQKRTSSVFLDRIENGLKALRGRHEALLDPVFFASKIAEERALRASVATHPELASATASAWDQIAGAEDELRRMHLRYELIEHGLFSDARLLNFARTLVRAADEIPKPNEKRLNEFSDSKLPALQHALFSPAPIEDELDALRLSMMFTNLRAKLGPDDPFVKLVLGKDSPEDLARELIKRTKLKDVKARKALFEGGKAAIDASTDPLIVLARAMEPEARALRKAYEEKVESVENKNGELIAKARFALLGTDVYPDATFTLRLSYGHVAGWSEDGKVIHPFTTFGGAFDRATGKDPFALPPSWLAAKGKLDLTTPFNFTTTNDIIGGNSGSPVINKDAEIVGLIFDGNIHSLGGDFGFDAAKNRAVSVHSEAIVESLKEVYGAGRILSELKR
jgi:hypothetical protein